MKNEGETKKTKTTKCSQKKRALVLAVDKMSKPQPRNVKCLIMDMLKVVLVIPIVAVVLDHEGLPVNES